MLLARGASGAAAGKALRPAVPSATARAPEDSQPLAQNEKQFFRRLAGAVTEAEFGKPALGGPSSARKLAKA